MSEHFVAQVQGGIAYYRSNIQVADDAGGNAGVISLSKIDPIQKLPGVAAALPTITLLARPGTVMDSPLRLADTIVYRDPRERAYAAVKIALAAGRQLDPNRHGEVVLGADVASDLNVRVGDSFDQSAPFTAIAVGAGTLALLFGALVLGATMLMTVAERTREIALKMTFGARAWHVAAEHLLEATAIALCGGVVGLVAGAALADLLHLAGRSGSVDVFPGTGRRAERAPAPAGGVGR